MANKVKVTYYGVEGEGRNLTEAKQNAGVRIEAMLGGNWQPLIRVHHYNGNQYTLFVWRGPEGWNYQIVAPRDNDVRLWGAYAAQDEDAAITMAYRHLAQYAMNPRENVWGMSFILSKDRHGLSDHRSYCQWQFRYLYFFKNGWSEDEAHRAASVFAPRQRYRERPGSFQCKAWLEIRTPKEMKFSFYSNFSAEKIG